MRIIEPEVFRRIEDEFCSKLPLIVRPKDAPEVVFASDVVRLGAPLVRAFAANALNLPSEEEFRNDYATTIGPVCWMPSKWSGWKRILVLTHEGHHAESFYTQALRYAEEYITDPNWRMLYEIDAESARWELERWLTGELPKAEVKRFGHGYAVDAATVDPHEATARQMLTTIDASIAGDYFNTRSGLAMRDAIVKHTGIEAGTVSRSDLYG